MDADEAYLKEAYQDLDGGGRGPGMLILPGFFGAFAALVIVRLLHAVFDAGLVPLISTIMGLGLCAGALLAGAIRRRQGADQQRAVPYALLGAFLLMICVVHWFWLSDRPDVRSPHWLLCIFGGSSIAGLFCVLGWILAESLTRPGGRLLVRASAALFGAALGLPAAALALRFLGVGAALAVESAAAAGLAGWFARKERKRWMMWIGSTWAAMLALATASCLTFPLSSGPRVHWDASSSVVIGRSDPSLIVRVDNNRSEAFGKPLPSRKEYELPFLLIQPRSVFIMGAVGNAQVTQCERKGAQVINASPLVQGISARRIPLYGYSWAELDDVAALAESDKGDLFDMIWIPLRADARPAESGALWMKADYALTRQSIASAYERLRPNGILVLEFWPGDEDLMLGMLHLVAAALQPDSQSIGRRTLVCRGRDIGLIIVGRTELLDLEKMDRLITYCAANSIEIYHASIVPGRDRFIKSTGKCARHCYIKSAPTEDRPFFFAGMIKPESCASRPFFLIRITLLLAFSLAALAALPSLRLLWPLRGAPLRGRFRARWALIAAAGSAPILLSPLGRRMAASIGRADIGAASLPAAIALGCAIGLLISDRIPASRKSQLIKVGMALLVAYIVLAMRGAPGMLISLAGGSVAWSAIAASVTAIPVGLGAGALVGAALSKSIENASDAPGSLAVLSATATSAWLFSQMLPTWLGFSNAALLGSGLCLMAAFLLPK